MAMEQTMHPQCNPLSGHHFTHSSNPTKPRHSRDLRVLIYSHWDPVLATVQEPAPNMEQGPVLTTDQEQAPPTVVPRSLRAPTIINSRQAIITHSSTSSRCHLTTTPALAPPPLAGMLTPMLEEGVLRLLMSGDISQQWPPSQKSRRNQTAFSLTPCPQKQLIVTRRRKKVRLTSPRCPPS